MTDTLESAADTKFIRWIATVLYRSANGYLIDVEHDLEELHELQELVERGPHWDTIDHIRIVRAGSAMRELTVEEAEQL